MSFQQAETDNAVLMKEWLESYVANKSVLFRVVRKIVRTGDIEDIVQETFIQSYSAARNREVRSPRAFMIATAKNLALNYIDRAEQKLCCSIEEMLDVEPLIQENYVESQCQSDEKFLVFCKAVAELPSGCRRIFVLKKIYDLSHQEIAAALKISPNTVEKQVTRGISLTAQYMFKNGYAVGKMKCVADRRVAFGWGQQEYAPREEAVQ